MVHTYVVPSLLASPFSVKQARITYLTNSEFDASGKARAIHNHTDVSEIGFVYGGHGRHIIGDRSYNSKPGDLLLYNTNILHQDLAQTAEEPLYLFVCAIADLNISGQPAGSFTDKPEHFLLESGRYFDYLLNSLRLLEDSLTKRLPGTAAFSQGFLQSLLAILGDLLPTNEQISCTPPKEELSIPEKMRSYIDQNYMENFSLTGLAEEFHINRYYAGHVFSETFHVSPLQYRTRRRIGEAQSLLACTDFSVTYIASLVGYDDPNQFSQMFSKLVGMSPSKYRSLSVR